MRTNKLLSRSAQTNRLRGFTLIELLIVLGIILAIAAMVVPNLLGQQQKANIQQTKINIKNLEQMVKLYAAEHNAEFPQNLGVLLQGEIVDGQQLPPTTDALPKDAWGNELYYEWPNTKSNLSLVPAIWSAGPNKANDDGGGDDINNWSDKGI